MFKIKIDTKDFNSHKRRNWNNQLYNDFAVAINGMEYVCNTEEEAIDRLNFIAGYGSSISWEGNMITLEDDRYGKQYMAICLPGYAQGYVDIKKVIEQVKKDGIKKIPFNSFYDLRQGKFFKGCFVEVSVQ